MVFTFKATMTTPGGGVNSRCQEMAEGRSQYLSSALQPVVRNFANLPCHGLPRA